ncbi:MAG: hypothetical protein IKZ09_10710 [Clostridia bacterium]|nr:hypothetical protein [Clostridia bacterium]
MSQQLYNALMEAGEPYAAALVIHTDRAPLYRYACAAASYFAHAALTPYDGGQLYPAGRCINKNAENAGIAVKPEFSYTYSADLGRLAQKVPEAAELLAVEFSRVVPVRPPHTVGGAGYTHSFINYRRILAEGLCGYRARVEALPEGDFRDAMLCLLDGIECYRLRCVAHLEEVGAPDALIDALRYVPNHTPRNVYEALVAWNFVYYVDGCDDIGGIDRGLYPYWHGEDIRDHLRELYRHVDINDGWSLPLGPQYNELTVQCIDAAHNIRRPNIQLLVTESMPEEVWEAAYASIGTSCGQPSFYNWDAYQREINRRLPQVTDADLQYLAFGGCTETMIEGLSNVGSDDAGINTALIFDEFLREKLDRYDTFDAFLDGYAAEAERVIAGVCDNLEEHRKTRAQFRPQPIRTLLIDDCIDRMTDFNAGGARYNWSVINVAGLINVIDSMQVVKTLVFEEARYSPAEFLEKLDAQEPQFLLDCARQPKHGNDNASVNEIASALSARIFSEFERHTCTPGGRYFAVSNQFTTYESAGRGVRATPDGRAAGEPLCDSCGAIRGRDTNGPTALLSSVAALHPDMVLGTPITNIRISKRNLPRVLKSLTQGYFAMNGMQLQVTCASREELLDAVAHPEKHENLVVRIGGFSEYFNRLSPTLKQSVIDRTEY